MNSDHVIYNQPHKALMLPGITSKINYKRENIWSERYGS